VAVVNITDLIREGREKKKEKCPRLTERKVGLEERGRGMRA